VVLAAGAGSRFGGTKLLARIDGRPVLQHVLDALANADITDIVVVLGRDAATIEQQIDWRAERRVLNREPERGLSSSLRVGLDAVSPDAEAALILLGDQPRVRTDVIDALCAAELPAGRSIVVPRYGEGGGPNPTLIARSAFALAAGLDGDRGFGPLIATRPELVLELPVWGSNPDVDTRRDLASIAEALWADRVRANRTQVERIREVGDGDFYASTTGLFIEDPRRTDAADPALAALRAEARPHDVWLDIGAGAGRYALPVALAVREVIAVETSPSMLEALRVGMRDNGIRNVRIIEGRWPTAAAELASPGVAPVADISLIAHVGYDIEEIGPFVDGMEAATRRRCLALLMERTPASLAEPFWPPVHGEDRIPLPALPAFVDLLRARGREPTVRRLVREARTFPERDAVLAFLRRQTWVAPDGPKDRRLQALLDQRLETNEDGSVSIEGVPDLRLGLVAWSPR
jgi:molybdenum cofactor cytidylyltransferase